MRKNQFGILLLCIMSHRTTHAVLEFLYPFCFRKHRGCQINEIPGQQPVTPDQNRQGNRSLPGNSEVVRQQSYYLHTLSLTLSEATGKPHIQSVLCNATSLLPTKIRVPVLTVAAWSTRTPSPHHSKRTWTWKFADLSKPQCRSSLSKLTALVDLALKFHLSLGICLFAVAFPPSVRASSVQPPPNCPQR